MGKKGIFRKLKIVNFISRYLKNGVFFDLVKFVQYGQEGLQTEKIQHIGKMEQSLGLKSKISKKNMLQKLQST